MKRFWVFVIISIVALGIGFSIFRFMSKDEVLYVRQTVYEINSGDVIELNVVHENEKKGTTITAISSNNSIIEKVEGEDYKFKAVNGGTTTITITSNKSGFIPVSVQVTVGDGSVSTPFFIKNKEELAKIGKAQVEGGESLIYPLTSSYKLVADFSLTTDNWEPIGANNDAGFTGMFDFNGHVISNLNISSATNNYAGLFAKIGVGGVVRSANIESATINANATYCGVIAGINLGQITNAKINNVSIDNNQSNAFVGGVVGLNHGTVEKTLVLNNSTNSINARGNESVVGGIAGACKLENADDTAKIVRCGAETSVSGTKAIGGIVGELKSGIVENCYAGTLDKDCNISTLTSTAKAGGIAGYVYSYKDTNNRVYKAYVADTYSVMKFTQSNAVVGGIIGENINLGQTSNESNVLYGNYYSTEIDTGVAGIGYINLNSTSPDVPYYDETIENLKLRNTYKSLYIGVTQQDWQFAEGVWTIEPNSLPKLSFAINYISSRVQIYISSNLVDNGNFYEKLSTADLKTEYELGSDIYLNSSENYEPFEFGGKLYCPLDETTGKPKYKIYLTVDSIVSVKDGYATVFSKLNQGAQLTNIEVVVNVNVDANYIAGLVGENNGVLENCSASGTIKTSLSTGNIYLAGLVAQNNGTITNSVSSVAIEYKNNPSKVYIGGICAYNTNTIQNSKNAGILYTETASSEEYVGGIAGYSSGAVLKCVNNGSISGKETATNAVIGGIVGLLDQNASARIVSCSSNAELKGSNVGGIVGISMGAIENCYSKASIEGVKVGGLAYNIKQGTVNSPSYIKNSMTDGSQLYGSNANSFVCGVVYQIDVTTDHLAYCEKIFTSAKFSGEGQFFYETTSNIRGDSRWAKQKSYIDENAFNNCIYVERNGNIERQTANFDTLTWDTLLDWSFSEKGKHDCPITEEQAKGTSGAYQVFIDNNFRTDVWEFNVGEYPKIKDVAK